jgi:uncharacterized protein YjbI with pentapeptide repeats
MSLDDFLDEGPRAETTPPVSAIAAKAEDLEAFRKSVEDSAGVSGGLWLSYLFVLFYLGVAAGAVTHADLLLQNPVKLPFLNIELPLLAFFFLAPLLFVITHAYTLVNLALLADRVRQFHQKIGDQFAADPALLPRASGIQSALTRQLPSNIFVQFLGGPEDIRKGAFGRSLAFILWVTLVVAPVALLLLLQIQFLPYHSWWIVWINRIALVLDLGLIWWLWGKILGSRANHSKAHIWSYAVNTSIAILLTVCIILFACIIATIPGEWQENDLPYQAASNSVRGWIFAGNVNDTTRRRTSLFSNTLVLPGFNIYEALNIDDPKKIEWKQHLVDLRGRDLRSAVLYGAVLSRADLTGAWLQGASLLQAQLQGASLDEAQLQGASLASAQLQGASLVGAQLQGAWLLQAQLQGALLRLAQLQGASLVGARLQGASLVQAQLQGAWLDAAQLQGASLNTANLRGASLGNAFLWRTQLMNSVVENIFAPAGRIYWTPSEAVSLSSSTPWTNATYTALRQSIEREIPEGAILRSALDRVAILDCASKDDGLASCDPAAAPPDAVTQWEKMIEAASINPSAYTKALAAILGDLVCTAEKGEGIYVLRGLLKSARINETGSEVSGLAKRITSTECPISKALTYADKREIALQSEFAAASKELSQSP